MIKATIFAFLACALAFNGYVLTRSNPYHLTLEMSSTALSTAEVFFDTGNSFNQNESSSVLVKSGSLNSFQTFAFTLPDKDIRNLRFDPIAIAGRIVIRHVALRAPDGREVLSIAPADIVPLNQIASVERHGAEVEIATAPQAPDPQLTFKLKARARLPRVGLPGEDRLLFIGNALLLAIFSAMLLLRRLVSQSGAAVSRGIRLVDARFAALAERLSVPGFLTFDAMALWFYTICLALFLAGGLAGLNGSALGVMSAHFGYGARATEWIGAPHPIRSDEWAFMTPHILNQALSDDAFEVQDTQMGNHSVALMGNIPVRHFSTIFRPQFWPFFVLPLDHAFAFYWQCKALFLTVGVFTWLLLLTRSSLASITGSLWYFFSQFTQWTYSWASALPELTGMICLSMVLFCYLTVGRNKIVLALAALAAALCSINFGLCAYVPHLIPLAWLAVLFFLAWCIAERRQIFVREAAASRIAAGCVAIALIAVTGLFVYRDLQVAIAGISNTVYPGHRIAPGAMSPWQIPSNFLQWWMTDGNVPPRFHSNICELSGFLWLAPFTLLCLGKLQLSRFQKSALAALGLCSLLLLPWMLFHLPLSYGIDLGLARTFGPRALPALGLANIAFVCTCMAAFRPRPGQVNIEHVTAVSACVLAGLFALLTLTNRHLEHFFQSRVVFLAALFVSILVWLLISGRKRLFAVALIVPHAIAFGTVNPVHRGLEVITSSEFYAFVQTHPELRKGKWLVFSDPNFGDRFDANVSSSLIAATGCRVYTSSRYLPDLDAVPLFAANQLDLNVLNRLGFTVARSLPPGSKPHVDIVGPTEIAFYFSPSDPLLRQLGITYVAFDRKPAPEISAVLTPLADKEVDGLWLYRLSNTSPQDEHRR
ncbi:MAG TPA: hypothetical protein VK604_03055 [Bryobacteraceae bacterium]|nr:hypothetical protein [Bryobacteraceae bacterium]